MIMMRAVGKREIVAAMVIVSLSFSVIRTPAAVDDIASEVAMEDERYREEGISMVPKGCRDKCGNVSIKYPFGIGPNKGCYFNKWYHINCTKSSDGVEKPYLRSFYEDRNGVGEILSISLYQHIITIKESISPIAGGSSNFSVIKNTKLSGSPFFYATSSSLYANKLMLLGCGNALLALPGGVKQGVCTSKCGKNNTDSCYAINCCQLSLPDDTYVRTYQVNFTDSVVNACNYVFFVEKDWFPKGFPGNRKEELLVPVVWRWNIDYLPPSASYNCWQLPSAQNQSDGSSVMNCSCAHSKKGNPYLPNGCQGDPKVTIKELSIIIGTGVGASFGFLLLLSCSYILYKAIKKREIEKQRQKFLMPLLAKVRAIEKAKVFKASELDKATDHFSATRILGQGAQGTVYKGMLIDGQIVAIKKLETMDENQLESFINEVVILSQINHRNVVKLFGCCLEKEVPILVYEFIPNGTLFNLIHNNFPDELIPLTWDIRIRIASEVASALAYLHSATSTPIYHRDIKSSNILLDEKFRAKVSDFGTSRSFSIDQTHLTTIVKGTFGYMDPEYFQSSQFTEKSDVYSFGVVLVELLTGQKPISFEVNGDEDRSLVTRFLSCMEEDHLTDILDAQVSEQGKNEDVMTIAWLALHCLNFNGKKRPTMKEVAMKLEAIRASHSHLPMVMETLETESDFIECEYVELSDEHIRT